MPKKETIAESEALSRIIIEGILKKKGEKVTSLNLTKLNNSVSDYFILCHANNPIQVEAIAESVIDETLKEFDAKPWHKEGYENAEWILLDYVDVVVHIFLEEKRSFYNLEDLWADADIQTYTD